MTGFFSTSSRGKVCSISPEIISQFTTVFLPRQKFSLPEFVNINFFQIWWLWFDLSQEVLITDYWNYRSFFYIFKRENQLYFPEIISQFHNLQEGKSALLPWNNFLILYCVSATAKILSSWNFQHQFFFRFDFIIIWFLNRGNDYLLLKLKEFFPHLQRGKISSISLK